ncbi:FecR domain-containing protein [Paenibacillus validus]|uniref:FecR family protein n=1 Tax=Paenibacillus validus TaxID=44253 RepID=UPI0018C33B75|nr:FecR family protein [Paenibacillus validus]
MRHETEAHQRKGRRTVSWAVTGTMVLSLLSSAFAEPASAKSVRSAVVVEVSGDVTYTKSGGSRSNTVYQDLTLNQGDTISTGPGASAVLRIVDRNDELTIGENAEVYISELMEDGGAKKSKVKAWAGSMWSKVKSLVSSEDEFEVETPTAVMGVRGTQFFIYTNPLTGRTTMLVAAGVVRATTVTSGTSGPGESSLQLTNTAAVYPAQQINLDTRTQAPDLRTRVEYADMNQIVNQASPKVMEAFVKNIPDIQRELDEMKQKLQQQFEQGLQKPDEFAILKFLSEDDLAKVMNNFDAAIPNLVKAAIDEKKIDRKMVDQANQNIEDPLKKIDLNKIPLLDKNAGIDPEVEKAKREQPPAPPKTGEDNLLQANKDKLSSLLNRLEEDKKRIKEANDAAKAAANKQAEDALLSRMTDEARKNFEQTQQNNPNPAPTPAPAPSNSSGDSGNTPPGAPVVKSAPRKALKNQSVTVVLTAEAGSKIKLNNETKDVVNGEAAFTVTVPSTLGVYRLHAVTINSAGTSADKEIAIEVVEPKVTLSQVGVKENNQIMLKLEMENFLEALPFYAVQAHVAYNKADLNYEAPDAGLPSDDGTIFDGANSAETLTQEVGTTEKQLIFAGTRYETPGSSPVPPINLKGETATLLFAPLTVTTSAASTQVKLMYVKVLDKDGRTVYELPVSATASAAVTLN